MGVQGHHDDIQAIINRGGRKRELATYPDNSPAAAQWRDEVMRQITSWLGTATSGAFAWGSRGTARAAS